MPLRYLILSAVLYYDISVKCGFFKMQSFDEQLKPAFTIGAFFYAILVWRKNGNTMNMETRRMA